MCHSDDSRPPAPPVSGGIGERADIRLTSSDGTGFQAHTARPETPNGRGVVILPDVRGLHAFYRELAAQFADAGFEAVAIDYFGRTAETDDRDESFDFMPHVHKTTPEGVAADVRAGVDHLRGLAEPPAAIFTVGFCFGGSASWRQAAHGHGIAGAIGFYGGAPLERVGPWIPDLAAPLLMLLAGVDNTTPEEFAEFAGRARATGIEVESHTYPDAPHSFFDRSFDDHQAACADAWQRILEFTERHSASPKLGFSTRA
ncbi:dienelactone hydrolase family protein [Actinophytocola sp.]|uniref:dienelactone hydrolase family protein n=1 Tax=Actinophytocola sp. TaxID=1872138 RepID=UPI002D80609E|nr:dienelactone hydrolase family protein [Actinophytocola sp.]HET9137953.1 dienelactone hydrolase family protein [Actinophytocola sp.]